VTWVPFNAGGLITNEQRHVKGISQNLLGPWVWARGREGSVTGRLAGSDDDAEKSQRSLRSSGEGQACEPWADSLRLLPCPAACRYNERKGGPPVRGGRPTRLFVRTSDGVSSAHLTGAVGSDTGEQLKSSPSVPAVNHADFEALYQRHSREVWALVYARWMNADTAMDITQEAFLRLWKQWESGETILNPRAWLLRVARNLAENHAKSAFRRNGTQPPQTLNGVHSQEPLPLETLEREETFAQLRRVLEELPQPDREILTLRYALDYNAGQIAELLAITTTAVHMRLSRARQRLAERLTAQGVVHIPP